MGAMVDVVCKSCNAGWQCMRGCGLMHGSLQAVADLFPEQTRRELMEEAGQTEFPVFDFAYKLSYCPHCCSIESVPVIRMPESYKAYIGPCPVCGQESKLIRDIARTKCPVCHEMALEERETGDWD